MVTDCGNPGNNWIFMVRRVIFWGKFRGKRRKSELVSIFLATIYCKSLLYTSPANDNVPHRKLWTATERLFLPFTHPTWSSNFLCSVKFALLNMIYSQLGYIFFCRAQSETLSKGIKEYGEPSCII